MSALRPHARDDDAIVLTWKRVPMGTDMGALPASLTERYNLVPQGLSAEMVAEGWNYTREQLDAFALESQQRAWRAIQEGRFANGLLPVKDAPQAPPRRSRPTSIPDLADDAEYGLKPRARIVDPVIVGSDPVIMLTGPIRASQKILRRTGMTPEDIDLVEINEAFAPVPLITM